MILRGLMCWKIPHPFCHWESVAWSKATPLYGLAERTLHDSTLRAARSRWKFMILSHMSTLEPGLQAYVKLRAELVVKVLGLNGNNHASRTIYLDGESGDEMSESDDGVGTYVDGQRSLWGRRERRSVPNEGRPRQRLVKNSMRMMTMNSPSAKKIQKMMKFMLMKFLVRMKIKKMMTIEYQQLMTFRKSINPMKMKLVLNMTTWRRRWGWYRCRRSWWRVRLSKRGTLKHEARTLWHLLTHRYKNPYCNSCVRAKMKHHKTYRGAFRRKLTNWRPHHLRLHGYSQDDQVGLWHGQRDSCHPRQVYRHNSGLPFSNQEHWRCCESGQVLYGKTNDQRSLLHKARQFVKGMEALKIPFDHALPGRPSTNSLADAHNQFVIATTTTCLLEAGLPACFWKFAIRCVCHLLNVEPGEDDVSAWCKLHGAEFKGDKIPFGALVYFNRVEPEPTNRLTSLIPRVSLVSLQAMK